MMRTFALFLSFTLALSPGAYAESFPGTLRPESTESEGVHAGLEEKLLKEDSRGSEAPAQYISPAGLEESIEAEWEQFLQGTKRKLGKFYGNLWTQVYLRTKTGKEIDPNGLIVPNSAELLEIPFSLALLVIELERVTELLHKKDYKLAEWVLEVRLVTMIRVLDSVLRVGGLTSNVEIEERFLAL